MSERKLKQVTLGEASGTTYIKLKPLTAEQAEKGIYKQLNVEESVAGVYTDTFVDDYKKSNYILTQDDGTKLAISNAGNLEKKMSQVPRGAYVEITYLGMSEIKSGPHKGKDSHGFNVAFEA